MREAICIYEEEDDPLVPMLSAENERKCMTSGIRRLPSPRINSMPSARENDYGSGDTMREREREASAIL